MSSSRSDDKIVASDESSGEESLSGLASTSKQPAGAEGKEKQRKSCLKKKQTDPVRPRRPGPKPTAVSFRAVSEDDVYKMPTADRMPKYEGGGCDCGDVCHPDTCQCISNEVNCQIEEPSFPCTCTRQECGNPFGRQEFNRPPGHTCQECGLTFSDAGFYAQHMWTKHTVSAHQCPTCSKCFANAAGVTRHISIVHHGTKPFQCGTCEKSFGQESHLVSHIRYIHEEPKFDCEECGKKFTEKSQLNRHTLVHKGVNPFICNICGKGFKQSSQLTIHRQRSHE